MIRPATPTDPQRYPAVISSMAAWRRSLAKWVIELENVQSNLMGCQGAVSAQVSTRPDSIGGQALTVLAARELEGHRDDLILVGNSRSAVSPGESFRMPFGFVLDSCELRGEELGISALQAQDRVQCRKRIRPELATIRVYSDLRAHQAEIADLGTAAQLTQGKLLRSSFGVLRFRRWLPRRRICHVQDHS
ncbi:hypothetical protein ACIRRA_35405 [Nocardia sp. NPDC101769]|uniref:hypothetical protein n=1 Tax=Nocardia sp. NPDC101769 TaxID=3364333 RepID=UPI0037F8A993